MLRRAHVAQHQQQHDRAQTAGDAVEERDAEDLGFAAVTAGRLLGGWLRLDGLGLGIRRNLAVQPFMANPSTGS